MAKSAEARESLLSFFHATHGPIIAIISTSFARFFLPEPGTHCALEARSKSRSLHPLQASGRVSVKRLSAFSVNAQLRPVVQPTASTILPFSPSRFAGNLRKRSRATSPVRLVRSLQMRKASRIAPKTRCGRSCHRVGGILPGKTDALDFHCFALGSPTALLLVRTWPPSIAPDRNQSSKAMAPDTQVSIGCLPAVTFVPARLVPRRSGGKK